MKQEQKMSCLQRDDGERREKSASGRKRKIRSVRKLFCFKKRSNLANDQSFIPHFPLHQSYRGWKFTDIHWWYYKHTFSTKNPISDEIDEVSFWWSFQVLKSKTKVTVIESKPEERHFTFQSKSLGRELGSNDVNFQVILRKCSFEGWKISINLLSSFEKISFVPKKDYSNQCITNQERSSVSLVCELGHFDSKKRWWTVTSSSNKKGLLSSCLK